MKIKVLIYILFVCSFIPADFGSPHNDFLSAFDKGDYELTVKLIDEQISSSEDSAASDYILYLKGTALMKAGKLPEALEIFESVKTDILRDNILYHSASICIGTGRNLKAEELLSEITDNHKKSPYFDHAGYLLAREYLKSGKTDSALHLLHAISKDKKSEYSRVAGFDELNVYLDTNRDDNFTGLLMSFLKENSSDDLALKIVNRISSKKGTEPESLGYLRLKLDVLYNNRVFDRAHSVAENLIKLDPIPENTDNCIYKSGKSLANINRNKEALERFTTLYETASEDNWKARAAYQISGIYLSENRIEDAFGLLSDVNRSFGSSPAASDCLFRQIRMCLEAGDIKQAIVLSEKYASSYRGRSDWRKACLYLGFLYLSEKRLDDALKIFSDAAGKPETWTPASGKDWRDREEAFFWKAALLEKSGREEEAFLIYDELVRKNPRGFYSLLIQKNKTMKNMPAPPAKDFQINNLDQEELKRHINYYEAFYRYPENIRTASLEALAELYRNHGSYKKFLDMNPAPVPSIEGLTDKSSKSDILLALHIFDEGADVYYDEHRKPGLQECVNLAEYHSLGKNYFESIKFAGKTAAMYPEGFPFQLYPEFLKNLLYPLPYKEIILEKAGLQGIPPQLIAAVIREESHFNAGIKSYAAARGLMQFIPSTADSIAEELGMKIASDDLYNPEVSISLGARYLRNLLNEFNNVYHAVASYNGGEGAVRRWVKRCSPGDPHEFIMNIEYGQTRDYVRKVMASYWNYIDIHGEEFALRTGSEDQDKLGS